MPTLRIEDSNMLLKGIKIPDVRIGPDPISIQTGAFIGGTGFLDTGCDGSVVKLSVAKQLGLKPIAEGGSVGLNGDTIRHSIYQLAVFFRPLEAPIQVEVAAIEDIPNDGEIFVLGRDLLARFLVTIDFPRNTFSLYSTR